MKLILICLALLVSSGAFSQSKKKQIEALQHQLDSITNVNKELQERNLARIEKLAEENMTLRKIMKKYIREIDDLNTLYHAMLEKNNELEKTYNAFRQQISPEKSINQPSEKKTNNLSTTTTTTKSRSSNSNSVKYAGLVRNRNVGQEAGIRTSRAQLSNVDVDHLEIGHDATITYNLTVDSEGNVVEFSSINSATNTTDLELINKIGLAIKEQVKYVKRTDVPFEKKLFEVNVQANSLNSTHSNVSEGRKMEESVGFGLDTGEQYQRGNRIGTAKTRTRVNDVNITAIEIKEDAVIYYKLILDADGNVVAFTHISNSTTTTDLTLINAIGVAIKEQVKYNKVEESPLVYQYYTVAVKANKQ